MQHKRAYFISFEGGEGCGKSTQLQHLSSALKQQHIEHVITREPGGTVLCERLRSLLVQPESEEWNPVSEMLLFMAARIQHIEHTIKPALNNGKWVLCDRFHDSSRIYQGVAKQCGVAFYDRLHRMTLGDLRPDLTFLLDIDPEIGLQRAAQRHDDETRFEELGISFHRVLRKGFLTLAQREAARFHVIDASKSEADVSASILSILESTIASC